MTLNSPLTLGAAPTNAGTQLGSVQTVAWSDVFAMTSDQTYTSGAITLNQGRYLCYVNMSGNYPSTGITNLIASVISFSGTGISGGSYDNIQRRVTWGDGYTYVMYSSMQPLLIVPATTSVTVGYKPYFTFTTSAVGINGAGSFASFIRIA